MRIRHAERQYCRHSRYPIYQIVIEWRQSHAGNTPWFYKEERCLHIDHVGLFFKGNNESDFEPNFIRRHAMMRDSGKIWIEAENAVEAIKTFYNEWNGAKVGGVMEKEKAIWINRKVPIVQLPRCDQLCWETSPAPDWEPLRMICGSTSCSGDCIASQPLECGFGYSDFTCENCPADRMRWDWKDVQKLNFRVHIVNGLPFKVIDAQLEPIGETA